jgi:hypothetical protein
MFDAWPAGKWMESTARKENLRGYKRNRKLYSNDASDASSVFSASLLRTGMSIPSVAYQELNCIVRLLQLF